MKSALVLITSLLLAALCITAVADTPRYEITDLGLRLRPTGISDSGLVVGFSLVPPYQAFFWKDGTKIDPPKGDSVESVARCVNNADQVIGYVKTADGVKRAVLWEGGVVRELGTDGTPVGINDLGQIVGWKAEGAQLQSAVKTSFGSLGGERTIARSINRLGKVVGFAETGEVACNAAGESRPVKHAFLWHEEKITDLGTLGGKESFAACINDLGQVAGSSYVDDTSVHAFLWQDGAMKDLGTLGGAVSEARSISGSGQVVGYARTSDNKQHAFLWEKDAMADLNALIPADSKWELREATAINNEGRIVGLGFLDGRMHGFLLTPVK